MRPFVLVNCAMSADGKIAGPERTQVAISSDEDKARAKGLRRKYDAILVGVGTVIADDPHLTLKDLDYDTNPIRIVLDPHGRTPDDARILDDRAPTIMVTLEGCDREWDCEEIYRLGKDEIDLKALLETLAEDVGIESLLVEGGGETIASFFRAGLVDRYSVFVGGLVIGGRTSPTPCDGPGRVCEGGLQMTLVSCEVLGNGAFLTFEPKRRSRLGRRLDGEFEIVAFGAEDLARDDRIGLSRGILHDLGEESGRVMAQGFRRVLREGEVVLDDDGQRLEGEHAGFSESHLVVVVAGVGDRLLERLACKGSVQSHGVDGSEDRRHRFDGEAQPVESQEYELDKGIAGARRIAGHFREDLHRYGHGLVGRRLRIREHDRGQRVDLPATVVGIVMNRDESLGDHLVEMHGEGRLGFLRDLGQIGQGEVAGLQFAEDLASDIVGDLYQSVLRIVELEISKRSVNHVSRAGISVMG